MHSAASHLRVNSVMSNKRKFVAVGTGSRLGTFTYNLVENYRDHAELVGLCDISQVRMDYHNRELAKRGYPAVPTYKAERFDQMLDEEKPDTVIVCSMDSTHDEYIVRAAAKGVNAITEKPMTTTAEKCQSILDAVEQYKTKCRVTLNCRFIPRPTAVRELIRDGVIGEVKAVSLNYMLNTSHGADYYRRWHSTMACSGGLLVHKCTHHFDLVNWYIDAIPEEVYAQGRLCFYGKENALKRGDDKFTGYDRYTGNATPQQDPFALRLDDDENLRQLYLEAEEETGYRRDQNVFREGIDIPDSMSVSVRYRNGVLLTYDINSYAPREGSRTIIHGDRGQIDLFSFGGSHIIRGQSDEELAAEQARDKGEEGLIVYPHFGNKYEVEPPPAQGGHGGSDPQIGRQIFDPNAKPDPLGRDAGHEQGAASILVGIAANESIRTGQPVKISDLVNLRPDAMKLSELI